MIGETSFNGVFVPTLLLLALLAMGATFVVTRLIGAFGLYRFVTYRSLVDLSIFVLILGLFAWLVPLLGHIL